MDYDQELYHLQRAMMKHADRSVFLADSDKFEKSALLKLADVNEAVTFVTDSGLRKEILELYQENGIEMIRGEQKLSLIHILWVVVALSFLLGFIITISEPDLQVLAQQVPAVPNLTLILAVACGVGVFLVVALLRMLFSIALPPLLVCFYAVIFILAFFVPKEFLSVAFDSGGVTTGPMTVPFIMALGVGISATRSDRHAADDSFGLVAL